MPDNMPPHINRIEIQNFDRMGRLVKSWATRKDHLKLNDGTDYTKWPATMEEMSKQMESAGVGATIPAEYMKRKLEFVQPDDDTYILRLPPKNLMEQSEKELEGMKPDEYLLPHFYSHLAFDDAKPNLAEDELVRFHDSRIGDYTVSNCR